MKIKKEKSKITDEIGDESLDEKNGGPMIIEGAPLDEELWKDWQAIMRIDRKKNTEPSRIHKKMKKKKFGNPIVIQSTSSCVPIPNLLRSITKEKFENRKDDILHDFTTSNLSKISGKVTIARTIVPDEIRKLRKCEKLKGLKHSHAPVSSESPNEDFDPDITANFNQTLDDNHVSILELNETANSSFRPQISGENELPDFYSLRNKVITMMAPNSKFSFHGKLKIRVLYGVIRIYGSTLDKNNTITPKEVYSSRGSSLVSIESAPSADPGAAADILKTLSSEIDETMSKDLLNLINKIENGSAVLELQNLENNLTNFLGTFCAHRLFPKLEDANYPRTDAKRAEITLQANFYGHNSGKTAVKFDRTDRVVEKILGERRNGSRVLLAGGKSVGKSTTARYVVNKLLETSKSVIFVDLDIGQAEFTPPGCISLNIVKSPLLGANFTHLECPHLQFYVGGSDVMKCLTNYIDGVRKLAKFLNEFSLAGKCPVVINTMGFCKGMGWDIASHVIKSLQPSDVIQISSNRAKNNFDQPLTDEIMKRQTPVWTKWSNISEIGESSLKYELHVLETEAESKGSSGESWNIEPHQKREIVVLSYLSEILNLKHSSNFVNLHQSINEVVPYQVPFSAVKLSLGGSTNHVLSVMNGNIVALCGIDIKDPRNKSTEDSGYPDVLIRSPLSSVCYGFGILRGVDMKTKKLYINTPLSMSGLKHVNCLIGSMPVPSGLLQLNRPGLPYAGGECHLPTSRDPRRGYFRMRHRNDI